MMKAGIYGGPGKVEVREIPKPVAGPHDVIVKNVRAGICGTDMTAYLYSGDPVSIFVDGEFGHEMVGIVAEVGREVTDIPVGARVFVNPATARKEGALKCDTAGAFSQFALVENAKWGYNLFRLADDVTFDEAVVIEPFSVSVHGKNRVGIVPGEHVVIYGAGPIGLCALCGVVNIGIRDAVVIDVNDQRLEMVKELGGVPFNSAKGDTQAFLKAHFGTASHHLGYPVADVDAVIDCAGAPSILQEFVASCKQDARLSMVAVAKQAVEFQTAQLMASEATVKGSCAYGTADIQEVIDSIEHHRTGVAKIVTHHFPHEKLAEAFAFAADPKNGSIKVVIDYE